jgi:hypothetical protein
MTPFKLSENSKISVNIPGQGKQEITDMKWIDFNTIEFAEEIKPLNVNYNEIKCEFSLHSIDKKLLCWMFFRGYKLPRKLKKKLFGTKRMRYKNILNARE